MNGRMEKMKVKKKYVILKVETDLSNEGLKDKFWWNEKVGRGTKVIQVQVNSIKPVKRKRTPNE